MLGCGWLVVLGGVGASEVRDSGGWDGELVWGEEGEGEGGHVGKRWAVGWEWWVERDGGAGNERGRKSSMMSVLAGKTLVGRGWRLSTDEEKLSKRVGRCRISKATRELTSLPMRPSPKRRSSPPFLSPSPSQVNTGAHSLVSDW